MTQEEKAKAYDEAMNELRDLHDNYNEISRLVDFKQELERIFPELKESEDERMRKEIISAIKEDWPGHTDWIAWLEKQEQKPAWSEKYIADVFEKVGLAKIVREQSNDNLTIALQSAMIELSKFTPQPKHEWSEEDERMCKAIIDNIKAICKEGYFVGNIDSGELINWFKDLKDRVLLQPRQEWSEEDKRKIDRIYSLLIQAADTHAFSTTCRLIGDKECIELQDFLKSLIPQSHWKPSDEQMTALRRMKAAIAGEGEIYKPLNSLYEDLKKLKGERL